MPDEPIEKLNIPESFNVLVRELKGLCLDVELLKDGKVVSHWAKYYRGELLKYIAKNNIQNFTELMNLEIPNLQLLEIQEKKNIKILVMNIC